MHEYHSTLLCMYCKVRSVGNEVCYDDQVKFESVKAEGQFLHCSSHPYKGNFPVLEQWSVHVDFMYVYVAIK